MTSNFNVEGIVTHFQSISATNTATAAINGSAVDLRNYPSVTRVTAVAVIGTMTEGTLTFSVEDSADGVSYAAVTPFSGANFAATTANDVSVNAFASYRPNPSRPYMRIVTAETVSVTTAVPFSAHFVLSPSTV